MPPIPRILHPCARNRYNAACGRIPARMFLETIYNDWLANGTDAASTAAQQARHFMLPNFENFYVGHLPTHARMGTFLCKHSACAKLMQNYVEDKNMTSKVNGRKMLYFLVLDIFW